MAISGDTIVVGAPSDDGGRGAVYVFEKPAGGWVSGTETAKLTAAEGDAGDALGFSVAIAGDAVAAGAPGPNPDRILVGGYNSTLPSDHSDIDLRGRQAWSGSNGPHFTRVVVDLSDFSGLEVLFRWRIRCDGAVSQEGWYVDDVRIYFGSDGGAIFADGFESGAAGAWSSQQPGG